MNSSTFWDITALRSVESYVLSRCFLCRLVLLPWRWRRHAPRSTWRYIPEDRTLSQMQSHEFITEARYRGMNNKINGHVVMRSLKRSHKAGTLSPFHCDTGRTSDYRRSNVVVMLILVSDDDPPTVWSSCLLPGLLRFHFLWATVGYSVTTQHICIMEMFWEYLVPLAVLT
jgi:hypothetical protein